MTLLSCPRINVCRKRLGERLKQTAQQLYIPSEGSSSLSSSFSSITPEKNKIKWIHFAYPGEKINYFIRTDTAIENSIQFTLKTYQNHSNRLF